MSSSLASSKLVVESEFFKVWKNCSTDLVYDQSISCLCTILEIQLPKLDSSRHCNAHTHTLHFMHYILPRKLIAQAWCHYSMYQNMEDRKEGGKRKWPIKEGLSRFSLTSFLLQQADMTLNRALSKWFHWTLHMFIFLSLSLGFFILYQWMVIIVVSWVVSALELIPCRLDARTCVCYPLTYRVELIKKNG